MDLRWLVIALFTYNHHLCTGTKLAKYRLNTQEDSRSVPAQATGQCIDTQRAFVDLKVGDASLTITGKTQDGDMAVCESGMSCCTHTMETQYMKAAHRDFKQTLQSSSTYLHKLLVDNTKHYQELFLQLLSGAHNRTDHLFSDVYHLPLMDRWGPTESLFLNLEAFLKQKDVSIHKSIETFFDELFPLVFHNNINDPRTSEITDEYRECLMTARRDVYPPPFGSIPFKLAHELSRSLTSARLFLVALRMGVHVVNTTRHLPLSESCQAAVTRLEFCGHCQGYTQTPPCRGFCYNVMRGCFAHVTDINIHWNEMIDALMLLTVNMQGTNDIETVLHTFHTKMSEAIMHAMETGLKFNDKVIQRCGRPKTPAGVSVTEKKLPHPDPSSALPTPLSGSTRLYAKIEMFMRNIQEAKGFLAHVPDTMCTEPRFSANIDQPCWNGQSINTYNKTIMTKDLAAQGHNPEVRVDPQPSTTILELTKQMQSLKKILSGKVGMDGTQSDQGKADDPNVHYNNNEQEGWYGSGDWYGDTYHGRTGYSSKGGYYYTPQDDEDWPGYSGSGSGQPPVAPPKRAGAGSNRDFTLEEDKTTHGPPYITDNPQPDGNVGVPPNTSPRSTGSIILLVLALYLYTLI